MASKTTKKRLVNIEEVKTDLRKAEPPLVDVKVSNPVTYLKSWWKRVMGNEGLDFRFRVKPLTAIAISIILITVSMGIGRFVLPFQVPFFEYTTSSPTPVPSVMPEEWRATAFSGTLRVNSLGEYFLDTSFEAIKLIVPSDLDLSTLLNKRIFASGLFSSQSRILQVSDAKDIEVLPSSPDPIPTNTPSPEPSSATISAILR